MSQGDDRPAGRILSRDESTALVKQITGMAVGGGTTVVGIESVWRGNLRWARNRITTCGDVRNTDIVVNRMIRGAYTTALTNQIDRLSLEGAVRRAERLLKGQPEALDLDASRSNIPMETFSEPTLWFDRTFALQADERAKIMRQLVQPAEDAGMLAAGYLEVSAHGRSFASATGQIFYYPFTQAQYTVTVRDPAGTGSGWAGVDWNDWGRIDAERLSAIALDKCLRSRNPVAIEPGRYTAILEPQAVADFLAPLVGSEELDRYSAEESQTRGPYSKPEIGWSKIGEPIVDERVTISADPMDPDLGFPPYNMQGSVYRAVNWIEHGVLQELSYEREYALRFLGRDTGLPNSTAFRMAGGTVSVDEMISTTKRGVLVTRFSDFETIEFRSMLCTGVTRDGFWLIENGKISKAVKNMRFIDSPLFVLNNLLDLGVPQRVYRPGVPAVVPPVKVQDFTFTSLVDAV